MTARGVLVPGLRAGQVATELPNTCGGIDAASKLRLTGATARKTSKTAKRQEDSEVTRKTAESRKTAKKYSNQDQHKYGGATDQRCDKNFYSSEGDVRAGYSSPCWYL